MQRRRLGPNVTLALLATLTALVAVLAMLEGEGSLENAELRGLLLELRAARVGAAFLSGAALAAGGVLVQGVFRNPLASPSILGATSGALTGGKGAMLLAEIAAPGTFLASAPIVLPIGALLGGLVSLTALLVVARRRRDPLALLLAGFVLGSFFLSLGAFLTSLAQQQWELGRAVVAFALGTLDGASRDQVMLVAPLAIAGVIAARGQASELDALLAGEDEAQTLGVDVAGAQRWAIIWVAVLTSAAVSLAGTVAFVGLIVPHALRMILGAEHRALVLPSALGGGLFVMICDLLTRVAPTRAEMPLGVVTGLIGAPVFLYLLARERGRGVRS